jgi:ligand-binding SRPBCC domain-containing protein
VHHELKTVTHLPLPLEEVFDFFACAENLELITPPELQFRILTPQPIVMERGSLIDYRLRLHKIPFRWRTLISLWNPPHSFVDEQLRGPYRKWIHTHRFEPNGEGTRMIDEVKYELPLWPLGKIAHVFVRPRLELIFLYRQQAVRRLLLPRSDNKNGAYLADSTDFEISIR